MPSPTEGHACAPTTVAVLKRLRTACQEIVQLPWPSCGCCLRDHRFSHLSRWLAPVHPIVKTDRTIPSLSHEVPAEVSWPSSELIGSHQSPRPHFFQHCPRTEAPSLHRHYPASAVLRASRHPKRPGLALAGCRLAHTPRLRLGLPVLRRSPLYMHAVAITPAEPLGAFIARFPSGGGLPRIADGSASALPFSRPAQRSLLVRPACSQNHYNGPLHRRLRPLRYLHDRSDCYRLER